MPNSESADQTIEIVHVGLIGLFVTALVTAQLTAAKILAFEIPFSLPIVGNELVMPGAALAIAVMFFASDCYTELYGRRAAQIVINVAFTMNFVVLALVWSTIISPAAQSSIDPSAFREVLGASTNIVAGSLIAYLLSQNWDVIAFHAIREYTDGAYLWLRNIGSTMTSQALDTIVFVTIAFLVLPRWVGIGPFIPLDVVLQLIVGQYLLKLLLALADTPLVYAVVGYAKARKTHRPRGTPE